MADYDCFNGDADGLCALHQLRMAAPRRARLVTGVKRDVALLERVEARAGDRITALDISMAENHAALESALAAGAEVFWADHHFPGEIPDHPGLAAHINTLPDTCSSLIVDRLLGGRYRAWAIVAAFGDNLEAVGVRLATAKGWDVEKIVRASRLGQALNYNAYGESVADLMIPPDELYERMRHYPDPLAFQAEESVVGELMRGMVADLAHAERLEPVVDHPWGALYVMPDQPWSRRVNGVFANRRAHCHPERAHAVLVPRCEGDGYTVSVRAPLRRPSGADRLCRRFPTGGGRLAAAGINCLPDGEAAEFIRAFAETFANEPTSKTERPADARREEA
jgi:hypothetical protein